MNRIRIAVGGGAVCVLDSVGTPFFLCSTPAMVRTKCCTSLRVRLCGFASCTENRGRTRLSGQPCWPSHLRSDSPDNVV